MDNKYREMEPTMELPARYIPGHIRYDDRVNRLFLVSEGQ